MIRRVGIELRSHYPLIAAVENLGQWTQSLIQPTLGEYECLFRLKALIKKKNDAFFYKSSD